MTDVQESMRAFCQSLVDDGSERGMQLVAFVDGRCVVDVSVGHADVARRRPVGGDTLFPVYSVSKGLVATIVHRLVERGLLAYDVPVANVWPAFAAKGKDGILLRHVLDHTAGMQLVPRELDRASILDWDAACAAIARSAPATPPGVAREYHAVTQGFILGELARRVDGRPFGRLVREELAAPLGDLDLFIGLPDALHDRVAELSDASAAPPPPDDGVARSVPNWMLPLHVWMNSPAAYRACVPASNGIATARALATHYAALLPGGVRDVELLPPERVRIATSYASPAPNPEGRSIWALGYRRGVAASPMGVTGFGHDGHGGSTAFADVRHRFAVGFTKNHFSPAGATGRVMARLRDVLALSA